MSARAAIRATRSGITHHAAQELRGRSLAFYNGAFSPPTRAHTQIVSWLAERHDVVWMDAEPATPRKRHWMNETLAARVQMCEATLDEMGLDTGAGVGTLRASLGDEHSNTTTLFDTLRSFVGGTGRLYWVVGADVAEGMQYWRPKVEAFTRPGVTCDGLIVFSREGTSVAAASRALAGLACSIEFVQQPADVSHLSSHQARVGLVEAADALDSASRADPDLAGLHGVLLPSVSRMCLSDPGVLDAYREQILSNDPAARE
jgi:nicotinic acid mononucleotide adenylyltransferase